MYVKWIGKVITILPLGEANNWKTKEKIITKAICFKLFKYLNKEILEKITASKGIKKAIPSRKKLSLGIKKVPIIIINKIPILLLDQVYEQCYFYIYIVQIQFYHSFVLPPTMILYNSSLVKGNLS